LRTKNDPGDGIFLVVGRNACYDHFMCALPELERALRHSGFLNFISRTKMDCSHTQAI
jgi:hypothetical protein